MIIIITTITFIIVLYDSECSDSWTTVNSQVLPREAELSCGLFCLIFLRDGVGIVSGLRIKWEKKRRALQIRGKARDLGRYDQLRLLCRNSLWQWPPEMWVTLTLNGEQALNTCPTLDSTTHGSKIWRHWNLLKVLSLLSFRIQPKWKFCNFYQRLKRN